MQSEFLQVSHNLQDASRQRMRDQVALNQQAFQNQILAKRFQDEQEDRQRKLGVQSAVSDLAKGFDAQSVRPEDLLMRTNTAVVDKYNQITNNGKRELTPKEMQVFNDTYTQGYNPTQSEASQYVSNKVLAAGGTAQEAANAAKLLSQQFDTKKEILANEAAQTKAYNDAEDKRVKREQFLVQMGMKANIANSKDGSKSTGGHYTFAHKPGDNEKYLDLLTNKASPDYMPIKYDDKQAKTLFNLLTSPRTETVNGKEKIIKGYTPAEAYEYITHSKDPGTWGTNYKFEYQNNGKIAKDVAKYVDGLRNEYGYAGRNKAAVPGLTDKQIAKITPNYVTSKSLGQLLADRNNYNKILDRLGKSITTSTGKQSSSTQHKKEAPTSNALLDALNSPKGDHALASLAVNNPEGFASMYGGLGSKQQSRVNKAIANDSIWLNEAAKGIKVNTAHNNKKRKEVSKEVNRSALNPYKPGMLVTEYPDTLSFYIAKEKYDKAHPKHIIPNGGDVENFLNGLINREPSKSSLSAEQLRNIKALQQSRNINLANTLLNPTARKNLK